LVFLAAAAEGFDIDGLAIHADHVGFVVKGVDVAGATVHEEKDDAFRLGGKVGLARGEGVERGIVAGCWCSLGDLIKETFLGKQTGESELGETSTYVLEKFTAVGTPAEIWLVSAHGFRIVNSEY